MDRRGGSGDRRTGGRPHTPHPTAVATDVDIVSDRQRKDDDGFNWTFLSCTRNVADVVPGAAVVMGSAVGRYVAKVISLDFETSDHNPVITLELLPVRPSEVDHSLKRNRTPAA